MKVPPQWQKNTMIVAGLLVIMAFLLVATGCTQQAPSTTTTTPVPVSSSTAVVPGTTIQQTLPASDGGKMVTFTESDNGATKEIAAPSQFAIQLMENPTTGFSWNATASPGLEILSSDYKENSHPDGMVGVGGTHTWILISNDSGTYTFNAVYKRPWEATTGNESGYNLTINVVHA
ncbi:protease inhibitor I42 family protein [Methanoregula sp.]|jgi:inhibitor of cysteine peptidase|uniref:protease inhibitor I42 family protein n=1 Tax=Methanoregula sp. TaxID=2052170 RepID=UPI003C1AAE4E